MKSNYTELEVWKKSRNLVKTIYSISQSFPSAEQYGLTNQIKRASVSIPSNIAEGVGRNTAKDTLQFLYYAGGSLNEVETQLYLALDLKFISNEKFEKIINEIIEVKKLVVGFKKYYEKLASTINKTIDSKATN